jgi:tetratricopeptide (TPR) repeat protein
LELDDTLAEAHSVLAEALSRYEWDFTSADREHQRAIALNPNYATGHQWYSHYLLPMGREAESLANSLRALELDPFNLIMNLHLGWHYFYVGENELAIEQLQQTLELGPTFVVANLFLGQVYEQESRFEEAIEQFERAVALSNRNPVHLAALAHAYGASGRRMGAEKLLEELLSSESYVPSYEIAVIYAGLDRQGDALTWLERAFQERDSSWLIDVALDPRFQHLHTSPRFQSLTQRLGLP